MKHRKGLTLIEIICVIAILFIVAAIITPVFARSKMEAKATAAKQNLKGFWHGLTIYQQDYEDKVQYGPVSEMGLPSPGSGFANFVMSYTKDYTRSWETKRAFCPCGIRVGDEKQEGLLYLGNGISDWPRDVNKFESRTVILADKNCNESSVRVECQMCDKRSIGITLVGQIIDKRNAERNFYDQYFYQE